MKRWTNGLPGATKRLGAMMAQRGLSASQPRMRADTHDGPEQMLHVRGLIHCCSSHVRRSWSFCLATRGRAIHHGTMRSAAMSAIWSLSGEKRTSRTSRFCRCGGHTRRAAARGGGARQRSLASRPRFRAVAVSSTSSPHTIRGRCYCVRNLYATIRATMLAKISSAGRDFRIIGIVEWRAADRPG
jgi:hypothetical protein